MEYNKLVRDNIPEIIIKNNQKPSTHIASEGEFKQALKNKLYEEVNEFIETPNPGEIADVLEVMYTICGCKENDIKEAEKFRQKKLKEKGSFSKRIILEKVD
jgi:predicted house-cleaning noncanonical NTP pyrophosphatase (MazG superfamily)